MEIHAQRKEKTYWYCRNICYYIQLGYSKNKKPCLKPIPSLLTGTFFIIEFILKIIFYFKEIKVFGILHIALAACRYLATSGSWPMHNRMASALMSSPQQGRQNNIRMMMPRWRITPTRSRFLPPNVWQRHIDNDNHSVTHSNE